MVLRLVLFCLSLFYANSAISQGVWDKKMTSVDGKQYSLNDFSESKALVLIFTRNTCPIAIDYEERINNIAMEFKNHATIVAINVEGNKKEGCKEDCPGESLEDMKAQAKSGNFCFLYLHEPTKILAHTLKAKTTPHVFVFGEHSITKEGKLGCRNLVYQGLIDSNLDSENVEESGRYLYNAIKSVLVGGKAPPSTTPKGCSIRY